MATMMIAVETSGVMQHLMIFNLLAGVQEIITYSSLLQVYEITHWKCSQCTLFSDVCIQFWLMCASEPTVVPVIDNSKLIWKQFLTKYKNIFLFLLQIEQINGNCNVHYNLSYLKNSIAISFSGATKTKFLLDTISSRKVMRIKKYTM